MTGKHWVQAGFVAALISVAAQASAAIANIDFNGPGVAGALVLHYGPSSDPSYPDAFEVTGINGTFTDTNNGLAIVDAPIDGLIAITRDTPEPGNLLAPTDFSRFPVASGLPAENHGFLTYDNLYWPGGSPQTASDYSPHGGFLDIYGLMFSIGNGRVVDLWSNGGAPADYGVGVATSAVALDYVGGGVAATASVPEPGTLLLLCAGALGLVAARKRAGVARAQPAKQF